MEVAKLNSAHLTLRIKHKGVFYLQGLFRTIRKWFMDRSYEFHESDIKHKVPSPAGYEEEYKMHGIKEVNAYIQFRIDVGFIIYDVREVEVIRDGKKHKLTHAALNMELFGTITYDYSNRFGGSKFLQNLEDFYLKNIIRKAKDLRWDDELYYRVYKLQQAIKEYLDFETKSNAYEGAW